MNQNTANIRTTSHGTNGLSRESLYDLRGLFRGTLILYVILVYIFYPVFHLMATNTPHSLYQYLTQGFLSGQSNLLVSPPAELLNLPDPYESNQNTGIRLHDASLYKGKYYLYFGPLPVVVFYMPFKWLTGFYPSDGFAAVFFITLGFIANFSLLLKIKAKYFPRVSELQVILAGLLVGFANGIPFLLARPQVYEVAISSAFCFMSVALFFLYNVFDKQYRTNDILLFSLCLSLSVAGRPHFALVCFIIIPALLIYLLRYTPENKRLTRVAALLVPAASLGIILGLYNYVRFESIFDFGNRWELSRTNMKALYAEVLHINNIPRNIKLGFYYNFLQPYVVSFKPFMISLPYHSGIVPIDKNYYIEAMAGVLTTSPFIVFILALPQLIRDSFKKGTQDNPLRWFLLFALLVPCTIIVFLLMIPIANQRYEVDFLPYLVMLSIITFWLLDDYSPQSNWFKVTKMLFIMAGIVSIYVGLNFSLAYWLWRVH